MQGSVLTTNGLDVKWSEHLVKIFYMLLLQEMTKPGTESLPYKSIAHAVQKAKNKSLREVENVNWWYRWYCRIL